MSVFQLLRQRNGGVHSRSDAKNPLCLQIVRISDGFGIPTPVSKRLRPRAIIGTSTRWCRMAEAKTMTGTLPNMISPIVPGRMAHLQPVAAQQH